MPPVSGDAVGTGLTHTCYDGEFPRNRAIEQAPFEGFSKFHLWLHTTLVNLGIKTRRGRMKLGSDIRLLGSAACGTAN